MHACYDYLMSNDETITDINEAFEDYRDQTNIAVEFTSQLAIVADVTQWLIDYPHIQVDPEDLIQIVTEEWVAIKNWQENGYEYRGI